MAEMLMLEISSKKSFTSGEQGLPWFPSDRGRLSRRSVSCHVDVSWDWPRRGCAVFAFSRAQDRSCYSKRALPCSRYLGEETNKRPAAPFLHVGQRITVVDDELDHNLYWSILIGGCAGHAQLPHLLVGIRSEVAHIRSLSSYSCYHRDCSWES